ncbi:LysR family transcriptional regulator [Cupriavidus basilensis]
MHASRPELSIPCCWFLFLLERAACRDKCPLLNPLRAFEVAARASQLYAGRRRAYVTPSAVSRQIKTLEESLGVQLFLREAKSHGC